FIYSSSNLNLRVRDIAARHFKREFLDNLEHKTGTILTLITNYRDSVFFHVYTRILNVEGMAIRICN
ncbi:hypothetical protein L9F63_014028, partial [Diploptera punctata]